MVSKQARLVYAPRTDIEFHLVIPWWQASLMTATWCHHERHDYVESLKGLLTAQVSPFFQWDCGLLSTPGLKRSRGDRDRQWLSTLTPAWLLHKTPCVSWVSPSHCSKSAFFTGRAEGACGRARPSVPVYTHWPSYHTVGKKIFFWRISQYFSKNKQTNKKIYRFFFLIQEHCYSQNMSFLLFQKAKCYWQWYIWAEASLYFLNHSC